MDEVMEEWIDATKRALAMIPPVQRVEFFDAIQEDFCRFCGSNDTNPQFCGCMNDD